MPPKRKNKAKKRGSAVSGLPAASNNPPVTTPAARATRSSRRLNPNTPHNDTCVAGSVPVADETPMISNRSVRHRAGPRKTRRAASQEGIVASVSTDISTDNTESPSLQSNETLGTDTAISDEVPAVNETPMISNLNSASPPKTPRGDALKDIVPSVSIDSPTVSITEEEEQEEGRSDLYPLNDAEVSSALGSMPYHPFAVWHQYSPPRILSRLLLSTHS